MPKFFIYRPVFAIVSAIVLTLSGIIAGLNLPIAQYPQITLPTVRVAGFYPGASSGVVEESVAQPIEEQVNGVEGMLYMSSSASGDGAYNLDVTFGLDVNADIAAVLSLHNCGPHPRHSKSRPIEGVHHCCATSLWPVADSSTACLIVAEPRDRGDLQPLIRTRRVDLNIKGSVMALAKVSGADLDHSIGQAKISDPALCSFNQFL